MFVNVSGFLRGVGSLAFSLIQLIPLVSAHNFAGFGCRPRIIRQKDGGAL